MAESPLVADAQVDEAFVAFFNEKYRQEYCRLTGDILLGAMCLYFPEVGKHGGGLEPPYTAEEQRSPRADSADSGILATEVPEHRRLLAVGGDAPLQTLTIQKGHIQIPFSGNQLTSPSVSLPKRPTTEVQKT